VIAYGVCAHPARLGQARALLKTLPLAARVISYDNGTLGELGNHDRTWQAVYELAMEEGLDWCVVLEDDAEPIPGFTDYLPSVLDSVPSGGMVSLYTGTGRPPQYQPIIEHACSIAQHNGASWLRSKQYKLLWGVAVAMPTHWIPDMLELVTEDFSPYDFRLGRFAWRSNLPVFYTYPSMVDHADGPTLIDHQDGQPRIEARKAWSTGVPLLNREVVVF
jgi:hypothetical protein